ncbi:MAG TPA: glucose-6-phosphate isomerase [Chthoniobacteraceae bacterium]|jgi:glucose-6-phosphate isomerase|nr:glucose-6-phosphate isomerase [Chthoniobacteraceae bacterium]
MSEQSLWDRYQAYLVRYDDLGISLDISRMRFTAQFLDGMSGKAEEAFARMQELEAGAIANPDENRMVGHYWLRNAALAPTSELRDEIESTKKAILEFAAQVHDGKITGEGAKFTNVLLVGIGGSALGPQFIAEALGKATDPMTVHFLDNTDPDGFDKTFEKIGRLSTTLTVVISKSGGTKETRNGMLEAQARYEAEGLNFAKHAVAVTGAGSELDKVAEKGGWLRRFPMWDWVGGRTSVMSAVGLVPMALQGLDIEKFLAGAAAMDAKTRIARTAENAAMRLAMMWYFAGDGKGKKDMVILPYKDRLVLFSKYLQQLVMESLGKERDLAGNIVHQGIAVYGNKGSTDQHAYVQQLREGVPNFFATFIEVRKDRDTPPLQVEPGVTSGDYLQGFLRGTRAALYENGRDSITISVPEVNAFTVGAMIALYERAVGFYASLVNINAYHQPGVEAGKKAAARILALQGKVRAALAGTAKTAEQLAGEIAADPEDVYHVLNHLAANLSNIERTKAERPDQETFRVR